MVKRFANGWGIGKAGGWIEQFEDDEGAIAERLEGFRGHALSLGPMATYLNKWDGGQVEFSARWLTEFNIKNRFEGNPFMVLASIQF